MLFLCFCAVPQKVSIYKDFCAFKLIQRYERKLNLSKENKDFAEQ